MPAFVHDRTFRALEMLDNIPAGCIGVIVTREDFDPHLRHAEIAIVDTADREPQHGELYAVTVVSWQGGRVAASLAIVQAYQRDGALWCRFGFKAPGLVPLCDGPFTENGWRHKCAGRIVGRCVRPGRRVDHGPDISTFPVEPSYRKLK